MPEKLPQKPLIHDFTESGVFAFQVDDGDVMFGADGDFGGGALVMEDTAWDWKSAGFDTSAEFDADTAGGFWGATTIDGSAVILDDTEPGNYLDTPKRRVRVRLTGATSPDLRFIATVYR